MLLPSSPPPSTLSAFVGLPKFFVGHLLSYWDPRNINKNGEFMGITLLLLKEKVSGLMNSDDITQFVMVVTTVSPKIFRDNHLFFLKKHVDAKQFMLNITASTNKTPYVDCQSILPAATVSYTVHVPRRAEEVDEAIPSFENEEKMHVSDCFKSIKLSSPLSLCVNEITILVCFFLFSTSLSLIICKLSPTRRVT
ncbi:hypothetical protein HID58_081583 [Brassica napus]|uniref:Uncharacterized protein n=1 Tax=Brassica napus TaxID=3708 RepID=A0ABQ7Y9W0_BRANA|nr:hypothetical protein HID58_081583 [Brassica napus]